MLDELRRAILTGEMAPGTPIRQDAIAERLGVSRVPLREALRTLEGEGQVTYRPHRGYQVADLSLDDLLEVYRIRELLETEATMKAVGSVDVATLEQAQRDIEKAALDNDIVGMAAANRQFHFAMLEASGMPRLTRLVRVLWDATDAYRALYYSHNDNRDRVHWEHLAIIEAVRAGDADEVVRLWNQHREGAIAHIRGLVS